MRRNVMVRNHVYGDVISLHDVDEDLRNFYYSIPATRGREVGSRILVRYYVYINH